ncbi:MAG TPA: glycosyltransferase, partial [Salinimicrobium sp.]|nr:glycosyltransferase [Salinimicrobium sp.]
LYPNQIIIVDGSLDDQTQEMLKEHHFPNLENFKVDEANRGLTKQRNFGIEKVNSESEVVCFLDDDTVLTENYFENLIKAYQLYPDAVGVGGYILEENIWKQKTGAVKADEFEYEGWVRKLGSRNVLRKKLGLLSDEEPGIMPSYSNGFSIGYLPPSGRIYPVEFFMGGVSSFKKKIFERIKFSTYFEGYGLYEDMDFCLRASKIGQLYVNTAAGLYHYHDDGGRPNKFKYGKMVVRNGWYVWRVKFPNPDFKSRVKWNAIVLTLTAIRFGNIFNTKNRKEALTETLGRLAGWFSLIFKRSKK